MTTHFSYYTFISQPICDSPLLWRVSQPGTDWPDPINMFQDASRLTNKYASIDDVSPFMSGKVCQYWTSCFPKTGKCTYCVPCAQTVCPSDLLPGKSVSTIIWTWLVSWSPHTSKICNQAGLCMKLLDFRLYMK